jgi:serine/threonine-protein kinase RsbW
LKIQVETVALSVLVMPEGRLDFGAAAAFQQHVEAVIAGAGTAPASVIIDCTALDYVSSAGLRVFLLAARASHRAGISFAVCALKPAVREVFELSGFSRMIAVHTDRTTALAHAPQRPAPKEQRTAVPNDAVHLSALTRFLQEFWSSAALPPAQALAFELALEEVFMNVVMHGPPAGSARVEVSLLLGGNDLTMTVADDAAEFNPLLVAAPDVTASLAERPVGGHGVSLVRRMMDTVSYQRIGARNHLTMTKHIAP